jgi:hypothetical protein
MKHLIPLLIVFIIFSSCKNETQPEVKKDAELNELFALMQGSFNSQIQ